MPAVLVTGMSGVGKTTALAGLAARGCRAVDTDDPGWTVEVAGEVVWDEVAVWALLGEPRDRPLFVSGTVSNQSRFRSGFDAVVLLSAPADVLVHRLRTRTDNPYGRTAADRAETLEHLVTVEPLLRASCTREVVTTVPPADVVSALLDCLDPGCRQRTG